MKYRWSLPESPPAGLADSLAGDLGISPVLAQCLVNRGVAEPDAAARFLRPQPQGFGGPVACCPNMAAAVQRLLRARQRGEPLVIFGDYDVDGVTSTALLLETLRALGWNVNYYLPHRMDEGYGLTREAAENCLQKHPAHVAAGGGLRLDLRGHHRLARPKRDRSHRARSPPGFRAAAPGRGAGQSAFGGPARDRSSVRRGWPSNWPTPWSSSSAKTGARPLSNYDLRPHLDLVALGTIADLVPLTGENRILASAGLERLTRRCGPAWWH